MDSYDSTIDPQEVFTEMNNNGTMNYLKAKEINLTLQTLLKFKPKLINNTFLLTDANSFRKDQYMLSHEAILAYLKQKGLKLTLNSITAEYPDKYPLIPKKSMIPIKLKIQENVDPIKELIKNRIKPSKAKFKPQPVQTPTNVSDSDPGLDLSD